MTVSNFPDQLKFIFIEMSTFPGGQGDISAQIHVISCSFLSDWGFISLIVTTQQTPHPSLRLITFFFPSRAFLTKLQRTSD